MTLGEYIKQNNLKFVTLHGYKRADGSELDNTPVEDLTEEELKIRIRLTDIKVYDEWFHNSIS